MKSKKFLYILIAIFACVLWSTAFPAVKIGLSEGHNRYFFAGTRFFFSGFLVMLFFIRFSWSRIKFYLSEVRKNFLFFAFIGVLQTFVMYALYYTALDYIDASISSIIMGTSPLWAAFTAHLLTRDDKITFHSVVAILLACSGIVVIGYGQGVKGSFGLIEIIGTFLFITSMTVSAISNVFTKKKPSVNSFVLNSFQLMFGGILLVSLSFAVESPLESSFTLSYWIVFVWLSLVSAISFSIWFYLLQKPEIKVSELNFWKFLIPVLGPILSWMLVDGDEYATTTLVGMIIVAIAIIYYYRPISHIKAKSL
ncbi:MAG: DMT family transporter [Spirochaetales bacterium]|nr:DMT family transporter [Spirochaetales bacterium]